jgi:anhydro-N-acetylmuramic acid kinase
MKTRLMEILKLKKRTTLGLMSGTSNDGLDIACCLIDPAQKSLENMASQTTSYPTALRRRIMDMTAPGKTTLESLIELSYDIGIFYVDAISEFLELHDMRPSSIDLIASHGQTLFHLGKTPTRRQTRVGTLQVGEAELLAKRLGIVTVSDFRWADIAAGGRGAPLTPIYHQERFAAEGRSRMIVNVGGIANVTLLSGTDSCKASDSGPGNSLSDHLMMELLEADYDNAGEVAQSGHVNDAVLRRLQGDEIFERPLPLALDRQEVVGMLTRNEVEMPESIEERRDLVATVIELAAWSIRRAYDSLADEENPEEVLACGGGVHNDFLLSRLQDYFKDSKISTTKEYGSDPDYVEAECFAYLANLTIWGMEGNLPQVTGAERKVVTGKISQP